MKKLIWSMQVTALTKYFHQRVLTTDLLNRCAIREARCDKSGGHPLAQADQEHLLEALHWLMRAQDVIPYGGLSRGYSFGWNPYFPKKGWQPPHPRPTAEAVNTFFNCSTTMSRIDLLHRAVDLADWLVKIQMPSGAIRGGVLDEPPSPEVLNTALAVTGWLRAWRETSAERFARATRRACDFLLGLQGKDAGARTRSFCAGEYSEAASRSTMGLALIQAGIVMEEYDYCAAGEKCMMQIIGRQQENGWFRGTRMDRSSDPLSQTIAMIVENVILSGLILDNSKYLQVATRTADALLNRFQEEGCLGGRMRSDWSMATSWSCLEGSGLMACVWLRLFHAAGEKKYLSAARQVIGVLERDQNRMTSNPGLRGGIKGSFPCDGDFGRYQTLSSATGQFINALLLLPGVSSERPNIPVPAASMALC
jgi:hypothetical protein